MKILTDMIRAFLYITLEGLYFVFQIISGIVNSVTRMISNFIQPALVEGLADINFIFVVALQGVASALSDMFLFVSKITLHTARYLHGVSEKLIEKSWYQN